MKPIVIILSLSLLSLRAVAGEATIFDDSFTSTRTRAEVHAEVVAALAAGERLSFGEGPHPEMARSTGTRQRAEVVAEAREARRLGTLDDGEATLRGRL
jgi:Domain of unknown function (DUF4148)